MDIPAIYLQDGLPYRPENAGGDYLGPLRLREALAGGRAAPAAQVLSWVGADRVLAAGRALGLPATEPLADGMAFAESGFLATLLDLSRAYAAIGNGGALAGRSSGNALPRPVTIRRIRDAQGEEVYTYEPATREVLDPALAFLLNDMLADSEARCLLPGCEDALALPDGRGAAVTAGASAAGDSWAIGYTPERLIGVWASDDSPNSAATLWRALIAWATAGAPVAEWPRPVDLRRIEVCAASGLLPSPGADCATIREWFVPGTEPSAVDTMAREAAINRETGRLATIFTPPPLVERREYLVYPPEAAAWATEAGRAAPPIEYDTIRRVPTRDGGAAVLSPEPWTVVSGRRTEDGSLTSVVGSAGGDGFAYYRLTYFPGLWPEEMQTIMERGETPVEAGELGVWDTTLLEDGLYTLLLTVVHRDGMFDEVAIPVTVANSDR
jgi:membrane peptidoglycan carboxypeptidase